MRNSIWFKADTLTTNGLHGFQVALPATNTLTHEHTHTHTSISPQNGTRQTAAINKSNWVRKITSFTNTNPGSQQQQRPFSHSE